MVEVTDKNLHDAAKAYTATEADVHDVVEPETPEDLATAVKEAYAKEIPIRVQGATTGTTSGCVPNKGDQHPERIISLHNLLEVPEVAGYERETIEIDIGRRIRVTYARNKDASEVILPAGITHSEREELLQSIGRFFPIKPTEQGATFGGSIATNATGLEGAFGSTRDWITRATFVLGDGEFVDMERGDSTFIPVHSTFLRTRDGTEIDLEMPGYQWRPGKNQTGIFAGRGNYPLDLFIGSEGALGICAHAGLRTLALENNADPIVTHLIYFDNEENALGFVRSCQGNSLGYNKATGGIRRKEGIVGCDWMDANALRIAREKGAPIPDNARIALEVATLNNEQAEALIMNLINDYKPLDDAIIGMEPGDIRRIREIRHSIPVAINEVTYEKVATDCAVPMEARAEMEDFWRERLEFYRERTGLDGAGFGHTFPSVWHMHYNLITTKASMELARIVQGQLITEAIKLGGVPSAEHGVGRKTVRVNGKDIPMLEAAYGINAIPQIEAMREQLRATRLNRGVYGCR